MRSPDLEPIITAQFALSADGTALTLKDGTPRIRNTIARTLVHLSYAGWIENIGVRLYRVTDAGRLIDRARPERLDLAYLLTVPEYVEARRKRGRHPKKRMRMSGQ
jgi:restriction endonuclease Mrr